MFQTIEVLAAAMQVVREAGCYVKTSEPNNTRDKVLQLLDAPGTLSLDAGKLLRVYALNMSGKSAYVSKVKRLATSDVCKFKDVGVLASVAGSWLRDQERKESLGETRWLGELGELVQAQLMVVDHREGWGRFGEWHLYKFADEQGSEVVWFASSEQDLPLQSKVNLTGRVKKTEMYRGCHQTTVTRCKVEVLAS